MIIDESTIESVRAYSDIQRIISEYVDLKKRGRNYIGLCPFHSEKTPSFTVSAEKKIFHCFGCHESGDLIAFLMKVDNLSFQEAIKLIAQKAGIEVKEKEGSYQNREEDQYKSRCFDCLVEAKRFFCDSLDSNKGAKDYIIDRGISSDTLAQFSLGYAPMQDELKEHLLKKGFTIEELLRSGLYYEHESGMFRPRFRDRIIIPILDHLGRTVAFAGRVLESDSRQAKYINSPETIVFNKRRILFGLDKSKSSIRKENSVIIMEGFMDVMMAHQYGIKNAVGSMGTALTSFHVQLMSRFTQHSILAMDSDNAGQDAIERSCDALKAVGFSIKVLQFQEKDPADVLQKEGRESFDRIMEESQDIIEYKFQRLLQKYDHNDIHNVSQIVDEIVPLLKMEKDAIIQNHFCSKIASELKINRELILAKLKNSGYIRKTKTYTPTVSIKNKYEKAEELLIYAFASSLELRRLLQHELTDDHFVIDLHRTVYQQIVGSTATDHDLLAEFMHEEARNVLSRILVEFHQKHENITELECRDCIQNIRERRTQKEIEDIKKQLDQKLDLSEEDEIVLLKKLNILVHEKRDYERDEYDLKK